MKRSPIKPGAKSLDRGSTFKAPGKGLRRRPPATVSDFRDDEGRAIVGREGMRSMDGRQDRPPVFSTLDRRRKKRRRAIPTATRASVKARSRGECIACRTFPPKPIDQLHHVLPVQRFPALELVEANLVGVCVGCHDGHERALPRIPRGRLPQCCLDLADSVGPQAVAYIRRTYP